MITSTIAHQRLHHQRIAHSAFQTPGEVVHWLGAVQAQDYASAEWTIGARLPGATPSVIEQAFADKTLVRTWLLRGTLHIVTAADLKWMLALLGPVLLARFAPVHRKQGLDAELIAQSHDLFVKILEGGAQLTRKELFAAFADAGLVIDGERVSVLLNRAALDGLICLGVTKGKQATFTLLDEWIPDANPLTRDEALAEFALRYFTSHGPTTLHDFAWWTGLLMADARSGLEAVKSQLQEETFEGKSYWRSLHTANMPPVSPVSPAVEAEPTVYLLAGFDEFVLGYGDRRAVMEAHHEKIISGVNAVFAYTMIWEGRVVGIWKRTFRKGTVEITFSPFASLPDPVMQAFAAAAQRYGQFLQLPIVIQ